MLKVITFSGKAEHGKDTTAELVKKQFEEAGSKVLIIHMADYLKFIAMKYFGWNGEKDEAGRKLLQWLGTEFVRAKFANFWVDTVIRLLNVFSDTVDYVLIPDC